MNLLLFMCNLLLPTDQLKESVTALDLSRISLSGTLEQIALLVTTLAQFKGLHTNALVLHQGSDNEPIRNAFPDATTHRSVARADALERNDAARFNSTVQFASLRNSDAASDVQKLPLNAWHSADVLHKLGRGQFIRVAVLDAGFNIAHPRLGHVEAVRSFVDGSPAFFDQSDSGHGTFCASVVSHIAPRAQLYLARVLRDSGAGSVKSLVQAIHWAIDSGCHVISMSLGTASPDPALLDAVARAQQRNVHIVCAATDSAERTNNMAYPARFGHVLCVGGADSRGQAAAASSGGRELDFLAPSEHILGADNRGANLLVAKSGTSVAVACVAGLVAVLLAHCDRSSAILRPLNCAELKSLLVEMCAHPGTHNHIEGYGMLCLSRRYVLHAALDVIAADVIAESKLDLIDALIRSLSEANGAYLIKRGGGHHLARHHIIPHCALTKLRLALESIARWPAAYEKTRARANIVFVQCSAWPVCLATARRKTTTSIARRGTTSSVRPTSTAATIRATAPRNASPCRFAATAFT